MSPLSQLSRDIADQGAWVGMPRARLEYWSTELADLDDAQKRILAAHLVVLARGIRQALQERGTMAVLQLVALVRLMMGERANVSLMFDLGEEPKTPYLGVVGQSPVRRRSADQGRRFFEMMTES